MFDGLVSYESSKGWGSWFMVGVLVGLGLIVYAHVKVGLWDWGVYDSILVCLFMLVLMLVIVTNGVSIGRLSVCLVEMCYEC